MADMCEVCGTAPGEEVCPSGWPRVYLLCLACALRKAVPGLPEETVQAFVNWGERDRARPDP
ncbi:hypothetical protein ACWGQL_32505 [Streptomyces lydicus]|uniref:hypothetical protein n=1 Tax=Streptomyces lydicus TaxID=47763 RepID=UPI0037CF731A